MFNPIVLLGEGVMAIVDGLLGKSGDQDIIKSSGLFAPISKSSYTSNSQRSKTFSNNYESYKKNKALSDAREVMKYGGTTKFKI